MKKNMGISATIVSLFLATFLARNAISQQEERQPNAIEIMAAENAMVGYDHGKHFQKKLLEFVSPVYKDALISSSLITGLMKPGEDASPAQQQAADRIALAGASSIAMELQARITEQTLRHQVMESQGMQIPGASAMRKAGGLSAKALEIQLGIEVLKAKQQAQSERYRLLQEARVERVRNRLEIIKTQPIQPVIAKSGRLQNFLLDTMKLTLLQYGYELSGDSKYGAEISGLKLPIDDFSRIQLQLDVEGVPIVFACTKGCGDIGKRPLAYNHPELLPIVENIESHFRAIAKAESDSEIYSELSKLSTTLQDLESASERVIGTARECAVKGQQQYRTWQMARDYRSRIRGLFNRLELEGNAKIIRFSEGKYDPAVYGTDIATFAKFVVDNGCKFAPGNIGDEAAYVRLQGLLMQLQAVLEE
jgi:hypothetical protein